MAAKLRHLISRLLPADVKYPISMMGSHISYRIATVLKGSMPVWDDDQDFCTIYRNIKSRLLLDKARAFVLLQAARRQQTVPGDIVEIGSYRCGSALLLTNDDSASNKTLHVVDTFAGLPEVSEKDPFWRKGDMGSTDFDEIKEYLQRTLKRTSYLIHRGLFPDEIQLGAFDRPLSLVHIDTDLYQPTLDALNFFYPRLASGGVIIVDDYGNSSCPGVLSAVSKFENASGFKSIYLISGQAIFVNHAGLTPRA